jgi:monooxygenase
MNCPSKSFMLLEARSEIGGTWDLFRYPGIRSDSDMHTLGYAFKPWKEAKAIADGGSILRYIRETAEEAGIDRQIRKSHRLERAEWFTDQACWKLTVRRTDTGQQVNFLAKFLLSCAGYYSYRAGYCPQFPGREHFKGLVVHPQDWPRDLDVAGQKIVVIGSGATAMTLVPALAERASHVTMLQRSPTYVVSRPDRDWIANVLRSVLPESWAYGLTRWKNVKLQQWAYRLSRTRPQKLREYLLRLVRKELGSEFDVDRHFSPTYDPWDQRLCLVPNGDLFKAIRSGKVSVVTDTIETFDENGILLRSGQHLPADVIVTATGLELVVGGEAVFEVDGTPVNVADRWSYKGCMLSGVPNFISVFGYINASWTLRADLIAQFACRLIQHMDSTGTAIVQPQMRPEDQPRNPRPWIQGFTPGYLQRAAHLLPKQGDREPWINPQDYSKDKRLFRHAPLEDGVLEFRKKCQKQ